MASWVFSLNANRMVVIHSQKWCLSLYRIREWFGKVTDKFVSRKIFQKFSVYLHFRSPLLCVFSRLRRVPACAARMFFWWRRKAEREKRV